MKGLAASGAAVAILAAGFQSPNHDATVLLSSSKAGAGHVQLTVRFPTVLRCGRPTGGDISLTLLRSAAAPNAIATAAVRVNGKAPSKVALSGRTVTVGLPVAHGMMCDSLVDGTLQLVFSPAAALHNPAAAGSYTMTIRQGHVSYAVPIAIHS